MQLWEMVVLDVPGYQGCVPDWSVEAKPCPYGQDIWIPFSSFTWHPEEAGVVEVVATFYSTIPFIIFATILGLCFMFRGTRELAALGLWCFESTVMTVAKAIIQQPRPVGSCIISCGMPSGHSISALCYLTWLLLEAYNKNNKEYFAEERTKHFLAILLCVLFLPVTWSRIFLHDHSLEQVTVGGIVGASVGGLWFLFMQTRFAFRLFELIVLKSKSCLEIAKNYQFPPAYEEPGRNPGQSYGAHCDSEGYNQLPPNSTTTA